MVIKEMVVADLTVVAEVVLEQVEVLEVVE
jgi:hypothetical protein